MSPQVPRGLLRSLTHGLGFPETTELPKPASGGGLTYRIVGKYWERLSALTFVLTTSGVAGNRTVLVLIENEDGKVVAASSAGGVQAATLARTYSFVDNVNVAGALAGTTFIAPLWDGFLRPGWQVVVSIDTVKAGDQITDPLITRERFLTGPSGYPEGGELEAAAQLRREREGN